MAKRKELNKPDSTEVADKEEVLAKILTDYLIKGLTQAEIGQKLGISQQAVSAKLSEVLSDERVLRRGTLQWKKGTALLSRQKALKIIESIDPDGLAEGQKAVSAGILIDKAQLLDGEPTQIIESRVLDGAKLLELLRRS